MEVSNQFVMKSYLVYFTYLSLIRSCSLFFSQVILVAASPVFHDLFMVDLSDQLDSTPSTSRGHPQNRTRTYWSTPESSRDVHMHDDGEPSPRRTSVPDNSHGGRARLLLEEQGLSVSPNGNTCVISTRARTSWGDVHMEERTGDLMNSGGDGSHHSHHGMMYDNQESKSSTSREPTIVPHSIRGLPGKVLNHPAFHSIHLQQTEDPISGKPTLRSVVVLNHKITLDAFRDILGFLYTGVLDPEKCASSLADIVTAATLLDLTDIVSMVDNIKHEEEYMNTEIVTHYIDSRRERLSELFAQKGLLSGRLV